MLFSCRSCEAGWRSPSRARGAAVGSRNGAWDVGRAYLLLPVSSGSASIARPYPGFHPLPHQTVREVLPHTAYRQPSSWGIRDLDSTDPSGPTPFGQIRKTAFSWLPSIVCAGVVVILTSGGVGADPVSPCTVTYLLAGHG